MIDIKIIRENKEKVIDNFICEYAMNFGKALNVYRYNVCLTMNDGAYEIEKESLEGKNGNYPNKNYRLIFETKNGVLNTIEEKDKIKRENLIEKTKNLLSKTSFVCLTEDYIIKYANKEFTSFLSEVYFCKALCFFTKIYLDEKDQHELYFLSNNILGQDDLRQFEFEILASFYKNMIGYSGVNDQLIAKKHFEQYKKAVHQLEMFIKIFKKELVTIEIDERDFGEYYKCELIMNYGNYKVNKEFESTGIKKLIRLYECFSAASKNGIVFIDELDSNLNDVYLCKLIEYFMYYGKGQLCFTTHNLDPMQVLKDNKNSIDFLSSDNHMVSWAARGNSSPDNCYRNGLIEDSPFNVDATDFIGIFGE